MKEAWGQLCKKKIEEIGDLLVNFFDDSNILHRFSVNHVEPFGYRTMPIILDYKLFVYIERTEKESGRHEQFREVFLGAYFNSGPRKLISFGQEYFDATYQTLIRVVGSTHKSVNSDMWHI